MCSAALFAAAMAASMRASSATVGRPSVLAEGGDRAPPVGPALESMRSELIKTGTK